MEREQETRLNLLVRLLEIAWTNFDRRRSYEWKFSLAIWTALAAFIALSLKAPTVHVCTGLEKAAVLIAAGLILVVQAYFQDRVRRANNVDKARAHTYEKEVNAQSNLNVAWEHVEAAIDRLGSSTRGVWSVLVHLAVTLVLVAVAAVLLCG